MHKNKKILIADDDPGILEVIQLMLEDDGYEVVIINDYKNTEQIQAHNPDLILLDIWMSGVDGTSICRELKSKDETKNIPIIMVSANKDTEALSLECGAEDFISKPFDIDFLLNKVEKNLLKNS